MSPKSANRKLQADFTSDVEQIRIASLCDDYKSVSWKINRLYTRLVDLDPSKVSADKVLGLLDKLSEGYDENGLSVFQRTLVRKNTISVSALFRLLKIIVERLAENNIPPETVLEYLERQLKPGWTVVHIHSNQNSSKHYCSLLSQLQEMGCASERIFDHLSHILISPGMKSVKNNYDIISHYFSLLEEECMKKELRSEHILAQLDWIFKNVTVPAELFEKYFKLCQQLLTAGVSANKMFAHLDSIDIYFYQPPEMPRLYNQHITLQIYLDLLKELHTKGIPSKELYTLIGQRSADNTSSLLVHYANIYAMEESQKIIDFILDIMDFKNDKSHVTKLLNQTDKEKRSVLSHLLYYSYYSDKLSYTSLSFRLYRYGLITQDEFDPKCNIKKFFLNEIKAIRNRGRRLQVLREIVGMCGTEHPLHQLYKPINRFQASRLFHPYANRMWDELCALHQSLENEIANVTEAPPKKISESTTPQESATTVMNNEKTAEPKQSRERKKEKHRRVKKSTGLPSYAEAIREKKVEQQIQSAPQPPEHIPYEEVHKKSSLSQLAL